MERITMSMDEELARDFDRMVQDRGYTHCVANLSYVYNHHERQLTERLTEAQHQHHDLVVATMHVHLDHEHCLESTVLKGPTIEVRAFADRTQAERGVRHTALNLVTVQTGDTHYRSGAHHHHGHLHLIPKR
jgi:CopG family nickel-responsive transcriptional regulator